MTNIRTPEPPRPSAAHDTLIEMTETVTLVDSARWAKGLQLRTSAAELEEREVPRDSYRVLSAPPDSPLAQPTADASPEVEAKPKPEPTLDTTDADPTTETD